MRRGVPLESRPHRNPRLCALMRRELLALLRCPQSGSTLKLTTFDDDASSDVHFGLLTSTDEAWIYPIVAGVPSMLARNVPSFFQQRFAAQIGAAGISLEAHLASGNEHWSFSEEWGSFFSSDLKR